MQIRNIIHILFLVWVLVAAVQLAWFLAFLAGALLIYLFIVRPRSDSKHFESVRNYLIDRHQRTVLPREVWTEMRRRGYNVRVTDDDPFYSL